MGLVLGPRTLVQQEFFTGALALSVARAVGGARGMILRLSTPATFTQATTADAASGQAVVTMGDTTALFRGMGVSGHANIPANAFILSKTATTITLSANIVTGTIASGSVLTFNSSTGATVAAITALALWDPADPASIPGESPSGGLLTVAPTSLAVPLGLAKTGCPIHVQPRLANSTAAEPNSLLLPGVLISGTLSTGSYVNIESWGLFDNDANYGGGPRGWNAFPA